MTRCFVHKFTATKAARVRLSFSSDNLLLHEIITRKLLLTAEASGMFLPFKISSNNTL